MDIDKQLLKGSMKMIVLHIISSSPCHGYEISSRITKLSDKSFSISEGTLYPLLHSLQADSYISASQEQIGGRKKKVYRLTSKGKKLLNEKKKEWNTFSSVMDSVIASLVIRE